MNLNELSEKLCSFTLKEQDKDSAMTTTNAENNVSISPLNNYEGISDDLFSYPFSQSCKFVEGHRTSSTIFCIDMNFLSKTSPSTPISIGN